MTSSTPQVAASTRSKTPPALAPEQPVAWPKRTVRTLASGLQVVLAESRAFPKISAQLYFRSGNAVVAHTAPGLAEMTSAVVRTGTASRESRRIEEDLRQFVPGLITRPAEEITLRCEQAVRNYDPCISCATHFLRLKIDRD